MTTPSNFVSVDDLVESDNILVYSEPGIGKTGFLMDCDLVIRMDRGTKTLQQLGYQGTIANAPTWLEITKTLQWIEDHPDKYKLIGVDSITKMHRLGMKYRLAEVHRNNPHRELDLPDKGEHQWIQNTVKRWIEQMCEWPADCVFTANVMSAENREGDERMLPYLHGQKGDLSRAICAEVDHLGYMEMKELKVRGSDRTKEVRRIHWRPAYDELYLGKSRGGKLPAHTDDVPLREIMASLKGGAKPNTSRRRATAGRRRATSNG